MTVGANRKILLTGGSGQVGCCLRGAPPADWDLHAPSHSEMDIADPVQVAAVLASGAFAAVINLAAYTAVDRAEDDVAACWRANALGPAVLADAAARAGLPILHVSTDYVFDGGKAASYVEDDPVAPLGVYGASKEGGEQAVRTANARHVIVRTAWVVSPYGGNFVKTMLRLGADRPVLRVVADQYGCPTSATDIARTVIAITQRLIDDPAAPVGTYHFVNGGEASWYDLARAIFVTAAEGGAPMPRVEPIATAEYPTRARRPANSRLSTLKLQRDYGIVPRDWQSAVADVVRALQPQPLDTPVKAS
jgi:dTDP-4-dehydrorhamnose reductase